MSRIKNFWKILMEPSDFSDDPYAEATNQLSHMALGVISSMTICVVWFAIFDEMPYRAPTWITIVGVYVIGIEIILQGWKGVDSFMDAFFVQCGVTMALGPVKEIAVEGKFVILEFNVKALGVLLLLSMIALVAHILPRVKKVG